MPRTHKNPTISFHISDYERREIDAKVKASGMLKKDYFVKGILVFLYLMDERHILEHLKRDIDGSVLQDVYADLELWKNEIHSLIIIND